MTDDKQPSVLLVDDDPSALRLLTHHVEQAGYRVHTACDGLEAMLVMLAEGPQLVITDWMMPEMDGAQLCKAIREHEAIAFAYVIIVTAHQTNEDQLVEAFNAGADDYLSKPFNARELLARLRAGERILTLQSELDARNIEAHRYNAEMEIVNEKLAHANEELNRMATTDELTKLANRREAMARLSTQWASAQRHELPLSIIALDIDRFKSCNDLHGHAAGDAVLKATATLLQRTTRQDETACRIGGEEFLIICPHASEAEAAIGAERMRKAVEKAVVSFGELSLGVTMSLGVAQRTEGMTDSDDLLRAADKALYRAKETGRNKVCLASDAGDNTGTAAAPAPPLTAAQPDA